MSFDAVTPDRRRRFVLLGLVALGGCGFTPLYGTGGAGRALQGQLRFVTPETELGFRVRRDLVSRFGEPEASATEVSITLSETSSAAAVTSDGDTTRFDITGIANWSAPSTDLSGKVQSFTGYSATGSTVATQAAERDARARLAQILADQLAVDLIVVLGASS